MARASMDSRFLADEQATEALGRRTGPGDTLRAALGCSGGSWGPARPPGPGGSCAGLGGDPDQVASPTYAVLHRYETPRGRVFHLDLYRLGEAGGWSLGLEDTVTAADYLVVEWAGRSGPWPTDWVAELTLEPGRGGASGRCWQDTPWAMRPDSIHDGRVDPSGSEHAATSGQAFRPSGHRRGPELCPDDGDRPAQGHPGRGGRPGLRARSGHPGAARGLPGGHEPHHLSPRPGPGRDQAAHGPDRAAGHEAGSPYLPVRRAAATGPPPWTM